MHSRTVRNMPLLSDGNLLCKLHFFCRSLRAAGVPVGPGRIVDAFSALSRIGLVRRDDVHAALRSVLVTHAGQYELFDQVFNLYFSGPSLLLRPAMPTTLPEQGTGDESAARSASAGRAAELPDRKLDEVPQADSAGTASDREALGTKDFQRMSADELAQVKRRLRDCLFPIEPVPTRRYAPHRRGDRYDMRGTVRRMMGSGGDLIEFPRKRRRRKSPDLVLLCDVSGSMSRYARAFLLFAHALASRPHRVRAFAFGTRLTNISRRLQCPDPDRALRRIAADVCDWDGGTRIAACLGHFNREWGRRVLARNATVVLLTDGLERDPNADLGFQMQRLQRTCRQLIWLNPMLRYERFEARAEGVRRMLPHVDRFLPAHNIDSLQAVCQLVAAPRRQAIERRKGPA